MDTTRSSLLLRIRDPNDSSAWSEFHRLYAPLLYHYAVARGLNHDDAEDVRALCFEAVVSQIAEFKYDKPKGGFKNWLRTIVNRRVVDLLRKRREVIADSRELQKLPADDIPAGDLWDQHWRQQHLRYCVAQASDMVSPQTYEAFRLLAEEGCSVSEVGKQLRLNANQVYKAKARVVAVVRKLMHSQFPEDCE